MKHSKTLAALCAGCVLATCAALFATKASPRGAVDVPEQGQTPTPITIGKGSGGNRPPMRVEDRVEVLEKRAEALEAENKSLREQLSNLEGKVKIAGALLANLDQQYTKHTHPLRLGFRSARQIVDDLSKPNPELIYLPFGTHGKIMEGAESRYTDPPKK